MNPILSHNSRDNIGNRFAHMYMIVPINMTWFHFEFINECPQLRCKLLFNHILTLYLIIRESIKCYFANKFSILRQSSLHKTTHHNPFREIEMQTNG